MRICFLTDYRTQHARRWIDYFRLNHDVHVVSTRPCAPAPPGIRLQQLPFLLTTGNTPDLISSGSPGGHAQSRVSSLRASPIGRSAAEFWRTHLLPLEALRLRRAFAFLAARIGPDLVHAMPLPAEGYLAALAGVRPLVVSVWGQDFVNYCRRSPVQRCFARRALRHVAGLTADCRRDIAAALTLGLPEDTPTAVFPGNGGVDMEFFRPQPHARAGSSVLPSDDSTVTVLYPRGVRSYVRLDTLVRAMPLVLMRQPHARFVIMGTNGDRRWSRQIRKIEPANRVLTVDFASKEKFAQLLAASDVMVSPSVSDGTPNSLLEAMSAGSFPVVGDIESVREWVTSGENGFLVDAGDSAALADKLSTAIADRSLRAKAATLNRAIIADRANYAAVMPQIEEFYECVRAAEAVA